MGDPEVHRVADSPGGRRSRLRAKGAVWVGAALALVSSADARAGDPGQTANTIELLSYQSTGFRFLVVP